MTIKVHLEKSRPLNKRGKQIQKANPSRHDVCPFFKGVRMKKKMANAD